jgi:hypothetical protein
MTSSRSTAALAAEAKRLHPDQFCPVARCLWRTGGGRCPRHPAPLAVELAEMEARDPKLRELGERIENFGRVIADRINCIHPGCLNPPAGAGAFCGKHQGEPAAAPAHRIFCPACSFNHKPGRPCGKLIGPLDE